jgi:hypothetical protein
MRISNEGVVNSALSGSYWVDVLVGVLQVQGCSGVCARLKLSEAQVMVFILGLFLDKYFSELT